MCTIKTFKADMNIKDYSEYSTVIPPTSWRNSSRLFENGIADRWSKN